MKQEQPNFNKKTQKCYKRKFAPLVLCLFVDLSDRKFQTLGDLSFRPF